MRMPCNPTSVYVAASSAEIARAERAMHLAQAAGFRVTSSWPESVREHGANPLDATAEDRRRWAWDCLRGVEEAEALWLLMPEGHSHGAFVELGRALALKKPVLVSGACPERSVFTALAHGCDPTDEEGFARLCRWRQCGVYL